MTSYMTVNGCKTIIEKDTAIGEHHPEYKETPLTDLHVHTQPAPEKFGLAVLRSAVHIRQRERRSNKAHEPLFLSQIRTGITTEGNKITYPFLLLQSYHHGVTVPNPVQEHNLNALFVILSSDIMYNEQTFDDQVIEYFVILVRE